MKTRKIIAGLTALTLAATMSMTAFAAAPPQGTQIGPDSTTKSGNTNVFYSVDPGYLVTFPASVELGDNAAVTAENVTLEKDQTLTVKLTGTSDTDDAFKLTTDAGAELEYTVSMGDLDVNVGDTVLEVEGYADIAEQQLTFNAPTTVQYAGDYTGTVEFTIAVENFVPVTTLNVDWNGDIYLRPGVFHTLTATVGPENATNKTLEWVDDSEEFDLDVSEDTLSCTIIAYAPGDGNVTVRTTDGSGLEKTYTVYIEDE